MSHSDSPTASNSRSLSSYKASLWTDYVQILSRVNKQLDAELRANAGIKLEDYRIITFLAEKVGEDGIPHTARMGEISQFLTCSPSKLTYQIDKLIQRGWIERNDIIYDRRGKGVRLTNLGHDISLKADEARKEQLDKLLFRHLSDDDIKNFSEILNKITDAY